MSQHLSPDDAQDENMSGITLTETPAAMSPPLPGHAQSLHSHIANLASESDEWEDDEDDDDEHDDLEGDHAMRAQVLELSRRTIAQLRRAAWKGGDEGDDDDDEDEHMGLGGMGMGNSFYQDNLRQRAMQDFRRSDKLLALNPYKLSLTSEDIESCLALETACFPPDIAATREKISYRLKAASGFCVGLFTTVYSDGENATFPTYAVGRPTEAGSDRKTVLVAQILVTLSNNTTVKDEDIEVPGKLKANSTRGGHQVTGKTVCLHSLAVLPQLQKARVGTTLMKSYIQMIQESKVVERIALIAEEELVSFYENLGFQSIGKSENQHGGHNWFDMVLEFPDDDEDDDSEM